MTKGYTFPYKTAKIKYYLDRSLIRQGYTFLTKSAKIKYLISSME